MANAWFAAVRTSGRDRAPQVGLSPSPPHLVPRYASSSGVSFLRRCARHTSMVLSGSATAARWVTRLRHLPLSSCFSSVATMPSTFSSRLRAVSRTAAARDDTWACTRSARTRTGATLLCSCTARPTLSLASDGLSASSRRPSTQSALSSRRRKGGESGAVLSGCILQLQHDHSRRCKSAKRPASGTDRPCCGHPGRRAWGKGFARRCCRVPPRRHAESCARPVAPTLPPVARVSCDPQHHARRGPLRHQALPGPAPRQVSSRAGRRVSQRAAQVAWCRRVQHGVAGARRPGAECARAGGTGWGCRCGGSPLLRRLAPPLRGSHQPGVAADTGSAGEGSEGRRVLWAHPDNTLVPDSHSLFRL